MTEFDSLDASKRQDKRFFGQPIGLATLFQTELWERFSYYGMRAILLYFMYYQTSKGGLGLDMALASSIMSIYGALVYFTGVFGGYIADRFIGTHKAVLIGGLSIMIGHIILALPSLGANSLYLSMIFIIMGTGLLKPNISTQVGSLYEESDTRRDAGFSIFVFGINLGAFISPLIVGMAPSHFSFHVGFSFAAVGMALGLIIYQWQSRKSLTSDTFKAAAPIAPEKKQAYIIRAVIAILVLAVLAIIAVVQHVKIDTIIELLSAIILIVPIAYFIMILTSKEITKSERLRVIAYLPMFFAAAIFWGLEEQGSVVLASFADKRTAYPDWFSPAWFQSLNPLFIMLYTPVAVALWTKLGKKQPSSPVKFGIGMFFSGASFLLMMLPGTLFGVDQKVGPLWLVASWALIIIGEILISPVGLSITSKLAPKAFAAQMMSLWFMANSFGQALNAQIVKFYSKDTEVAYFGWIGLFTILVGIVMLVIAPRIRKLMGDVL